MSFAETPGFSVPSTRTWNVFDFRCSRHWVASTCSTSLVPMPNASAPNAPCVAVWLSPQTTVMPGCVSPSSGPITCTMPCRSLWMPRQRNAELACSWSRAARVAWRRSGRRWAASGRVVGMLWSAVAMVRSGRRTLSPRSRRPVEGLRRRHFMHQVQVDEQQRGRARPARGRRGNPRVFR